MSEASSPTVGELNELAVLARIFPRLPEADAAIVGPGDDAAVLSAPDARYVVTTDMMVHGPDFRLAWSTPFELGWKAAATNLSDVAAMGAVPTAIVVALAVPPTLSVSVVEGFADGLRAACSALAPGCGVVGGDLSASDTLTIAVTAFGDLQGRPPVLRSGARVGDLVAIAGELGLAAEGLGLLFREAVDDDGRPDAGLADELRMRHPAAMRAQLAPTPPIAAGPVAAIAGATAMLDVSDGLSLDSARIARSSGVGIDFDVAALGDDPERALGGGEDHGLLATFPAGGEVPAPFRIIGRVTDAAGTVSVDGTPHAVVGWDPYSGWDGAAG
ncbi:thiamine-phosphate kinase [Leifsonia sp. Leaf264]|uniref:thiamine-phosphate kinase n=1 Tax=Leifsonia sp. Leaf264 TaxID=1736314 RepID=UPI0006F8D5F7|nr:thiamine-phosphate kinase [Leifsonia sp. Leaf264]KQP01329.1 thiamine-monophosphate kinase [Leifsonia sp. Leaf264]